MKRLVYTSAARRDLVEIYDFLDDIAGSELAQATVARLRFECRHLAEISGTLGRPRPELRSDLRSFPFQGYVIFFRYLDDVLEIVDVLSARRDVGARFED